MATTTPTDTQVQLSFTPEYKIVQAQKTKLTFNAQLSAPEISEDSAKRSTISLTAVIDKSGSMSGEKLDLVKRTCEFMLNQLSSKDKMGLVEYDSDVSELIPLSRTSDTFKAEARHVISSMEAGSCTNLSGGLLEGVSQQQANRFVDWDTGDAPESKDDDSSSSATSEPAGLDPVVELASESQLAEDAGEMMMAPKKSKSLVHKFRSVARRALGKTKKKAEPAAKPMAAPGSQRRHSPPGTPPQVRQMAPWQGRQRRHLSLGGSSKRMFDGRKAGKSGTVEEDAVRSVLLFTDGLANEGITGTAELVATLGQRLDAAPRVRVCTFGFGADHSPELLAELARVGAGTYYFMEKEESIPTAFADALGGLLSVAAQNVRVEFQPADGVTVAQVHAAYPTSEGAGGGRSVAVGDLLSEERKDLLFEVELAGAAAGEAVLGKLVVSYLDVQGGCLRQSEVECRVQRAEEVDAAVAADEGVALQKARVETAASMAAARRAAEGGDLDGAKGMLERCLARVEGVQSAGALKAQLCADLEEAQSNMRDRRTYAARGSKLMWAKGKAHSEQRSACLSDSEGEDSDREEAPAPPRSTHFSYANSTQKSLRSKARSLKAF